jgi:Putative metallopeptidase
MLRRHANMRLHATVLAIACGVFSLAAATTGRAAPAASIKPATDVSLSTAQVDFVVSNTIFALLHEMGHVIIRDFEVPLLGMEEDSADTLAALIMLSGRSVGANTEETKKLTRALALAAVGNAMTWKTGLEQKDTEILFWDQHGLSARRASRIACLIYGSNPKLYAWVADSAKMPDRRRDNCGDEYELAHHAGVWVYDTYGNRGRHIEESPTPQVTVAYGPAKGDRQESMRQLLEQRRFVEAVVAKVDAQFAFKKPLVVKIDRCGRPNAYWDPDYRELQLCYELLESFAQLSTDPGVAKAYATISAAQGAADH